MQLITIQRWGRGQIRNSSRIKYWQVARKINQIAMAGAPNLTRLSMSKTALIILNMRRCVSKMTAIEGVILILSNQY